MLAQITLEEALKLVSFKHVRGLGWLVCAVDGNVHGNVNGFVYGNVKGYVKGNVDGNVNGDVGGDVGGNVDGNVKGNVDGNVHGDVCGYVDGIVKGTINDRDWESVETPKDKLQRFIEESGNQELIDAFNQMEDN